MKRKVYRLKSETRRRLFRLYCAIGRLLQFDDSADGLRSPSDFRIVRPYLFAMYSYLWARDDESLVKFILEEVPSWKTVSKNDSGEVSDLPF